MKKMIFLIIIFILLFPIGVQAIGNDTIKESRDNNQADGLINYINNIKSKNELIGSIDARTYIKDFMLSGDGKFSNKKLVQAIINYSLKEVISCLKLMGSLIVICVVCALLSNLQKAFGSEGLSDVAYFACYAMLIVIISKSFLIGVDLAKTTINSLTDFMAALMPVLMMLIASVGGISEATVMDPLVIGTINICARVYVDIIIPIILISFVLQFVNNMSNEFKITKLTKLMNQLALWVQGGIMTIFIGMITIKGITTKTVDEVAVKTAKYAVDNFIPIVGKSLSDAISTVAGYSILLKNAISGLGLLLVIALVLFPVIKLFLMAMIYKFTAACVEPISDTKLTDCINAAGDSIILLMSCLISVSVMFFIMLAIIASAGKMAMG
ncbi:MAG: stage III sporulation protein AE [Clostridiaceae bacterium]|nr:stage III sporulation protein AE [Clostridiaceae bacterium]